MYIVIPVRKFTVFWAKNSILLGFLCTDVRQEIAVHTATGYRLSFNPHRGKIFLLSM
jgi:hypothetical protein